MSTAATTKPAKKTAAPRQATPGEDIDALFELREKKRKLEASIKDLEGQASLIEERLMENMDKDGIDKMTGRKASVSISSSVVANVEDWDAFTAFIHKNKAYHLFQRRVSDAAYREMLEIKKVVPGTQPFTKKRLNLRAVSA